VEQIGIHVCSIDKLQSCVQVQGNATGGGGCWWESEANSHRTIKYVSRAQELAGSINQQC
jgi:hypothetical protein